MKKKPEETIDTNVSYVLLDTSKIKVKEGLDRFRKDLGDIGELAKSIKETGQIVPIIINRQYELMDGGRRIAACMQLGIQIKAIFEDIVDPLQMRAWEIEANLHRKDFTPAERLLATKEFHELKQKQFGIASPGIQGGHTLDATAKMLGKSKASIVDDIALANMIEQFPQLKNVQKKSHIKKAARNLSKLVEAAQGAAKHEEKMSQGTSMFKIYCEDAAAFMGKLKKESVDVILTDPLYGFDHDELDSSTRSVKGNIAKEGFHFDDDPTTSLDLYNKLAHESYRFTTYKAQGFAFLPPQHWEKIRDMFEAAKWRVYPKPIIWIKSQGQGNIPSNWPISAYEMLIFFRKEPAKLVVEGRFDWLQADMVNHSKKIHRYEKPVPLCTALLERISLPGQTLYDPFFGSGAIIEAGMHMRLNCIGTDNSPEAYNTAIKRLTEVNDKIKGGKS